MTEYCFMIQPFDNGRFDKRFEDVFKPAIEDAKINLYRVDNDDTVFIPIDTIEERIRNCRFCLADITTDNPNVWYEVGYAIAMNKDVILICSSERTNKYPFDIQHRSILHYNIDSPSDFDSLKASITKRAQALLNRPLTTVPSIIINQSIAGLDFKEVTFLGAILRNQNSPEESVSAWLIKNDMKQNGLNEIAFNISSRKLMLKSLIEIKMEHDSDGEEYSMYSLTANGDKWILENEEKFDVGFVAENERYESVINDEELPF